MYSNHKEHYSKKDIVTAQQISAEILDGLKTPSRVLADYRDKENFPTPLLNLSKKPLYWRRSDIQEFYFPGSSVQEPTPA